MALTLKQQSFVDEYIIDFNATKAAIRANYSKKTANRIASENLSKPVIQTAIALAMESRNKRVKVDADYVLSRLVEIDNMDVLDILHEDGSLKVISDWPKAWRTTLSGFDINESFDDETGTVAVLKKIKWPDKLKNLELLGKHVVVNAFKEHKEVEHKGEVGHTHSYKDTSDAELDRRIKELEKKNGSNA